MNETQFYQDLGSLIASRRGALGLGQSEIAKRAGISRASLANMEVGRQRVLLHQLYKVAAALELDNPQYLLPTIASSPTQSLSMGGAQLTAKQQAQIEQLLSLVPTRKVRSP